MRLSRSNARETDRLSIQARVYKAENEREAGNRGRIGWPELDRRSATGSSCRSDRLMGRSLPTSRFAAQRSLRFTCYDPRSRSIRLRLLEDQRPSGAAPDLVARGVGAAGSNGPPTPSSIRSASGAPCGSNRRAREIVKASSVCLGPWRGRKDQENLGPVGGTASGSPRRRGRRRWPSWRWAGRGWRCRSWRR